MEQLFRSNWNLLLTYSSRAITDFSLIRRKGYAGNTGRLDILVRTIRLIDEDEELVKRINLGYVMVLEGPPNPPLTVYIRPGFWKDCPSHRCSEGEAMEYFKERVIMRDEAYAFRKSLKETVNELRRLGYNIVVLSENGEPYTKVLDEKPDEHNVFVVGGYDDPPQWLQEADYADAVSLGPKSYLASHAAYFLLKCFSLRRGKTSD